MQLQQVNGRGGESDEDAFGGGEDAEAVHERIVVLEPAVHFPVADDPFLIPHSDLVIHLFCSVSCFFCLPRVARCNVKFSGYAAGSQLGAGGCGGGLECCFGQVVL